MITRPTLPPKVGYVEVEVNGVHTYKNVKTGALITDEVVTDTEPTQLDIIEAQVAYTAMMTNTLLEV